MVDINGIYTGIDIETNLPVTLGLTAQAGNAVSGSITYQSPFGTVSLAGEMRTDPSDPQAAYVALTGEPSSAIGFLTLTGYTEGGSPRVFYLQVSYAVAGQGGAHYANSQLIVFTHT